MEHTKQREHGLVVIILKRAKVHTAVDMLMKHTIMMSGTVTWEDPSVQIPSKISVSLTEVKSISFKFMVNTGELKMEEKFEIGWKFQSVE